MNGVAAALAPCPLEETGAAASGTARPWWRPLSEVLTVFVLGEPQSRTVQRLVNAESEGWESPLESARARIVQRIGSEGPSSGALSRAATWLVSSQNALQASWFEPHMVASPDREVVMEWWVGERKLTAYFAAEGSSLIRVWGPNIESEMEESNAEEKEQTIRAWRWLCER